MPGDLIMPKPDMSTAKAAVEQGARIFERVETAVKDVQADVDKLRPVFAGGPGFGLFGMLEAGEIDAELRAIIGALADVERRIYTLHRRGTKIAQDHNIDIPTTRGGGPR